MKACGGMCPTRDTYSCRSRTHCDHPCICGPCALIRTCTGAPDRAFCTGARGGLLMVRHRQRAGGAQGSVDSFQHANGSVLIPIAAPPSWSANYFYVVNNVDELSQTVEPLRCLRLAERDVGRSTRRVTLEGVPHFSVFVAVLAALDSPSGYVSPWEIFIGTETFASLHPPPWIVFATDIGEGSVSYGVERVTPDALRNERDLRLSQVERAMRSSRLLDDVRRSRRRTVVQWFDDGDRPWGESSFESGRELFDALIDPATRNRPHLIGFPDGWYTNGFNWLM